MMDFRSREIQSYEQLKHGLEAEYLGKQNMHISSANSTRSSNDQEKALKNSGTK